MNRWIYWVVVLVIKTNNKKNTIHFQVHDRWNLCQRPVYFILFRGTTKSKDEACLQFQRVTKRLLDWNESDTVCDARKLRWTALSLIVVLRFHCCIEGRVRWDDLGDFRQQMEQKFLGVVLYPLVWGSAELFAKSCVHRKYCHLLGFDMDFPNWPPSYNDAKSRRNLSLSINSKKYLF